MYASQMADVIGRRVIVQLLVPLLHPGPVLLLDVVPVHDVQDLVAHRLGVAAAADRAQHGAHPLLRRAAGLAVRLRAGCTAPVCSVSYRPLVMPEGLRSRWQRLTAPWRTGQRVHTPAVPAGRVARDMLQEAGYRQMSLRSYH